MSQPPLIRERRHGWDPDYSGPERRRSGRDLHSQNVRRFNQIETRMEAIERELHENTTVTLEVKELMELGRSGFKVLGWIGVLAKWVTAVTAAGVAVYGLGYMATHGGRPPGT